MSTQIDIIIYSIDKENMYLLSTEIDNNKLPYIDISSNTINSLNLDVSFYIEEKIKEYTNIDISWTKPKIIDIDLNLEESELITHIYYACYIPYVSKTNGHWVAVNKQIITNKIIKKILFYA